MIQVSEPVLDGKEAAYVSDCVGTGWISSAGAYIERFENAWAEYCGMKHGIAVSNGTTALQVAVDALRLGPGDEVIVPSFTIISCVNAIVLAGATPVVVDCDPATYCMNVDHVRAAITPRTRAIMVIHMYGHPVDMDAILQMAEVHGLAIIEDAAQAHGVEYLSRRNGSPSWRRCGSFGTISTFSFFANKLVTTGEGGMVLTNDENLAARCRSLRNLCFQARRFVHEEMGYNFRMTNIQAAIGLAQVERFDAILAKKRWMGGLYDRLLKGINGIQTPVQREWARVNYWMYTLLLGDGVGLDAVGFAARLKERGVETRPFFLGMHEQPVFRRRGLFQGLCLPVTERVYRKGLYVPSGLGLTEGDIRTVVAAVAESLR